MRAGPPARGAAALPAAVVARSRRGYRPAMSFPERLLVPGEEVALDLREHWIALVVPAFLTIGIAVVAGLILAFAPGSWPSWFRWAVLLLALVALWAWPLQGFVRWGSSHFVVTSHRVIHRSGLLARHAMEIPLERISDVHFSQGILQRMIGAGTLTIESAGEFGQQQFENVRDPEDVQRVIYEEAQASTRTVTVPTIPRPGGGSPVVSVADELEKLDRLRRQGVLTDEEFAAQKARLLGAP